MSRVLVTGASGFIGRHCLPTLIDHGHTVHAVARRPLAGVDGDIHWHAVDLLDSVARAALVASVKPTHLLHLAWYAEPGQYWTSEANFRWVSASLDLLDRVHQSGGRRAVLAGSCAEYANSTEPCHENLTPLMPASAYGVCKSALGTLAQSWSQRSGVAVAAGRVFHLYGPHEHSQRLVPSIVRALLAGEPADCTAGTQRRDYLSVVDVAAAFVALLESTASGAVNIGSGLPVSVADLAREIARQIGRPELLRLGARPMGDEPALIVADLGRLRTEVGWVPGRTLNEGLADTIAWWRRQAEFKDNR